MNLEDRILFGNNTLKLHKMRKYRKYHMDGDIDCESSFEDWAQLVI